VTNFRNFDLNLLLVLDGVLREGTLSNAAKALNVSQPTISSSLAKLREILQDELFVRSGNGMQPTPRALALKEPIQRVLAAVKGEILDTVRFDPATEIRPTRSRLRTLANRCFSLAWSPGWRRTRPG
jgi:DNA-binding transcriptional LysR family regulator